MCGTALSVSNDTLPGAFGILCQVFTAITTDVVSPAHPARYDRISGQSWNFPTLSYITPYVRRQHIQTAAKRQQLKSVCPSKSTSAMKPALTVCPSGRHCVIKSQSQRFIRIVRFRLRPDAANCSVQSLL